MLPKFRSAEFLTNHIRSILAFYENRARDPNGGYYQNFFDDGTTFQEQSRQLVSSCRMVFNFTVASELFPEHRQYRALAQHGLDYVRQVHWQNERQGYAWVLENGTAVDETNHCYGLAFVLLMYATVLKAGDESARADVYHTYSLLEKNFWQPDENLYADDITPDWQHVSAYRGQNANMHVCEAMIFAYEATGDEQFLDRACVLARTIAVTQADKADGLIWEHYTPDLNIDWDYNRDDPKHLYRPWGFQPGHQTEWSKLLIMLHRHKPEDWMIKRATALFDAAVSKAWDEHHGGLYYGFSPDGSICDDDKYFWVQAESFAAAALLARVTGKEKYWQWYERLWAYSWNNMVDHQHGAWYRILNADNSKMTDRKSEMGAKCDYHTIGACLLVLEWQQQPSK